MRWSLIALAPLAASVAALSVDEPKKGAEVDVSGSFVVKWSSVDSDPSSFDLYLVNNAIYPSVSKKIASGIDTSKGSYTVDDIDVSSGHGYQINMLSDSKLNTGILAQSQQFNITGDSHSSSSSTTASSTTGTTTASTADSTTTKDTTTGTLVKTTSSGSTATAASGSSTPSGSVSGSVTGSSATPTTAPNAGDSLVARPLAIVGVVAGALALTM